MSLFVPSGSHSSHEPLPSLPPSPTEEDLGGSSLWMDDADEDAQNHERLVKGGAKGKERAREISLDEESEEHEDFVSSGPDGGYPPQKDEEAESRKIEENLKRLEQQERQRRKVARESAAYAAPSSVVNDVSRRASLLWRNRGRSGSGGGSANITGHSVHSQLGQSSEDALPLHDFHTSSNTLVSPIGSKPPSPTSPRAISLSIPAIVENPFEPPDSATPLRSFSEESAVMRPSSPPPPIPASVDALADRPLGDGVEGRPTLQATSSFSQPQPSMTSPSLSPLPPPPLPLDLPPPKTPPPRTNTPGGTPVVTTPPKRVDLPSSTRRSNTSSPDQNFPDQEHRWWTDWLCGCREEKERDNTARTNPFE